MTLFIGGLAITRRLPSARLIMICAALVCCLRPKVSMGS